MVYVLLIYKMLTNSLRFMSLNGGLLLLFNLTSNFRNGYKSNKIKKKLSIFDIEEEKIVIYIRIPKLYRKKIRMLAKVI